MRFLIPAGVLALGLMLALSQNASAFVLVHGSKTVSVSSVTGVALTVTGSATFGGQTNNNPPAPVSVSVVIRNSNSFDWRAGVVSVVSNPVGSGKCVAGDLVLTGFPITENVLVPKKVGTTNGTLAFSAGTLTASGAKDCVNQTITISLSIHE